MLTVDFDRLGVVPGSHVLDLGCGAGRHAFEAYRRGGDVVAFDQDAPELAGVAEMFEAMAAQNQVPPGAAARTVTGDALDPPFPDESFDCVIASEILEHIPEDEKAIWQLARLVRPGGTVAVTVPRALPERICWWLSTEYHEVEGGHVRIYRKHELLDKLSSTGLRSIGHEYAHALHAPYWWLKCAVGVDRRTHPLTDAYHRMLVWDLLHAPWITRTAERLLNPVLGKSLVLYFVKQGAPLASR